MDNRLDMDALTLARKSIWRQRGLRFTTGMNVGFSLVLAVILGLMVNYISYNFYYRWDLSWKKYYRLSEKTLSLVSGLEKDVDVYVFFQEGNELVPEIRALLLEYKFAASKARKIRLRIQPFVDPDRDLARTRELKQKYDLRDVNIIVLDCEGRRKYVTERDLNEMTVSFEGSRPAVKRIGFKGEQAISSAIQTVVQGGTPIVYFVSGHGERDIMDYQPPGFGFSDVARTMRRDNMDVRRLNLAEQKMIPKDCAALVLAGPEKKLSSAEVDVISSYLDKNGRVLFLIDPTVDSGLDAVLEKWGVHIRPEVVVGQTLTFGNELVIEDYGTHPVTRSLHDIVTVFFRPRFIEAISPDGKSTDSVDKPTVTPLAMNKIDGWAEAKLDENPAKFDPLTDRRGPVSVAVAVEKGSISGIDVEIKPSRLIVVGDSSFVSNAGLKAGASGNMDFFMNSINWLIARESLMAIGPKFPGELKLDMTRKKQTQAFLLMSCGIPVLFALIGAAVWKGRRS